MSSISIITVVYNGEKTIESCIQSVLKQKIAPLEYLIVDGNSNDKTKSIICRYAHSLKHLSEPDHGIYDAMNKGINLVTGDIIGFLNSDDIYENENILATVQEAFKQDPSLDIVYGDLIYVAADDLEKKVRTWKSKPYYTTFFEDGQVPPHPSFFVKRSILLENEGFDTSFSIAADYDLMYRLLKIENRKSEHISQVFVRMRLGGKSNASLKNIVKGNQEIIKIWKKYNAKLTYSFWTKRLLQKIKQF